jgi:ATP-dependent DNA ligase
MNLSSIHQGIFVKPSGASLRGVTQQADLDKIWNEIGPCFGYLKPDGWRIQLHMKDGELSLFSRAARDMVNDFPHLAQRLYKDLGKIDLIMDTEIVGLDKFGGHLPPSRITKASEHVIIILDSLFIDERNITGLPTTERVKETYAFFQRYIN